MASDLGMHCLPMSNKKDAMLIWVNSLPELKPPFTFCPLGVLSSAVFFSKSTFSKNSFRSTIRVSNSLDPDQSWCFVGPDLGPNRLQKLSANDTRR